MEMDSGARSKSASSSGRHGFMGASSKDSRGGFDLSMNPPSSNIGRSFSANTSPRFANIELKESTSQPQPQGAHSWGVQPPMSASVLQSTGSKREGLERTFSAPVAPWSSSKRVGGAPVKGAADMSLSMKKHRKERDFLSSTPKLSHGNTNNAGDKSHLLGVQLPEVIDAGDKPVASPGKKMDVEASANAKLKRMTQAWGKASPDDTTGNLSQRLVPHHAAFTTSTYTSVDARTELSSPMKTVQVPGMVDSSGRTYHTSQGEFLLSLRPSMLANAQDWASHADGKDQGDRSPRLPGRDGDSGSSNGKIHVVGGGVDPSYYEPGAFTVLPSSMDHEKIKWVACPRRLRGSCTVQVLASFPRQTMPKITWALLPMET